MNLKKITSVCVVALLGAVVFAEPAETEKPGEGTIGPEERPQQQKERKIEKADWPVWLAFNSTKNIDVIGLRLTLPYGACENVTGFDFGVLGRSRYMEGLQVNLLRNDVTDILAGIQVGVYNSAGRADMFGCQVGLWNEVHSICGFQVGLINLAETMSGVQIGLINRTESLYGFQVGGVNVIRESELPFFPIVNIGFNVLTDPRF